MSSLLGISLAKQYPDNRETTTIVRSSLLDDGNGVGAAISFAAITY
jgi:hypothetical protein